MTHLPIPIRAALRTAGPGIDGFRRYWRTRVIRRPRPVDNWFADNGDLTLRLAYPLDKDSIVVDVGGFQGNWTQQISDRYQCTVHVFEPVLAYRLALQERFAANPRIVVYPFGLADRDVQVRMALRGDASSALVRAGQDAETVELRDVAEVLDPMRSAGVALIKINIEGGEYDLLPRMIEAGLTDVCRDIQVQFHSWPEGAAERRRSIQQSLSRSHRLTYDYPFVWENWRLR